MPVQASDIAEAERTLQTLKRNYLREHGWQETCRVPGSYWVWQKTLHNGQQLMAGTDMAIGMEFSLSPWSFDDEEE